MLEVKFNCTLHARSLRREQASNAQKRLDGLNDPTQRTDSEGN